MKYIKSFARGILSILLLWIFSIALGALFTFGILDIISQIMFYIIIIVPALLWIYEKAENIWKNNKTKDS